MRTTVLFDDTLRTQKGKVIPYYDEIRLEHTVKDKELAWFHEGYGVMHLYRLHRVDNTDTFIAEYTGKACRTNNDNWETYSEHPELAL